MNAPRLRELLTFAEDHPDRIDTTVYGELDRSGGIVGDLAGHALVLSGWKLTADNTFMYPEDGRTVCRGAEIEAEACAVLGLTEDELWAGRDLDRLFGLPADAAVKQLRELTEQAEAATANA